MNHGALNTSNNPEVYLVKSLHISNATGSDLTEIQKDSNQDPHLDYVTTVMNKTYDFETKLSRDKTVNINKEAANLLVQTGSREDDILNDSFKQSSNQTGSDLGDHIAQIDNSAIQHADLNKVELPFSNNVANYRKKSSNYSIVSEKIFLVSNYNSDDD